MQIMQVLCSLVGLFIINCFFFKSLSSTMKLARTFSHCLKSIVFATIELKIGWTDR